MTRPFSPDYKSTVKSVLGAGGSMTLDLGDSLTGRSLRICNSGAGTVLFAVSANQGDLVAVDMGVAVLTTQSIIVFIGANQRYFSMRSSGGATVFITLGQGGV